MLLRAAPLVAQHAFRRLGMRPPLHGQQLSDLRRAPRPLGLPGENQHARHGRDDETGGQSVGAGDRAGGIAMHGVRRSCGEVKKTGLDWRDLGLV